jgi:hypothetical protein
MATVSVGRGGTAKRGPPPPGRVPRSPEAQKPGLSDTRLVKQEKNK